MDTLTEQLTTFIQSMGIEIAYRPLPTNTFLPGLSIEQGMLVIDTAQLKYPGDLLHEAGHIAVVPANERVSLTAETIGNRSTNAAEEMMAIAWSYAACKELGIDPHIVFHESGYKGGGADIVKNFNEGKTFGVPMLQYAGMTFDPKRATEHGAAAYPAMQQWLRD